MKLSLAALVIGLSLACISQPVMAQKEANKPAPDVRIKVSLKNGSAIMGVARAGVIWERSTRRGFVPAGEDRGRRSGVRVWYYQNVDGFIFLPARTIAEIAKQGSLSAVESRNLRQALARAEKSRRVKAVPLSRESDSPGDEAEMELSLEDVNLLSQFPPEKGWGPAVFGEIERRRIVLEIEPTPEEKKFVEVFPQWEKAFNKRQASRDEAKPAKPENPQSPPTEPRPVRGGAGKTGTGVRGG